MFPARLLLSVDLSKISIGEVGCPIANIQVTHDVDVWLIQLRIVQTMKGVFNF